MLSFLQLRIFLVQYLNPLLLKETSNGGVTVYEEFIHQGYNAV
jgi:hypothetical protein